ncbi:MAG: tRNA (adenosine(37)-N6)-dimethylallyltransferase MiaA [Muribaculaceae bacterium]|nr:tRNA (adenosine(37)-N6)-dimethylallyltransferase MiaA [Muribaculaceae bacterium]
MNNKPLICITGPTASGKTSHAVAVARAVSGEIVSADSRQIYKGMDLGTGKDIEEYQEVPYHMIDIVPAGYRYNLYEYLRDADAAINDISRRGRVPVIAGGTGLYIESVVKGIHLPEVPENVELRESLKDKSLDELTGILASMKRLHNHTDTDSAKRAIRAIEIEQYYKEHPDEASQVFPASPRKAIIVATDISREDRRNRISSRLQARIEAGMIEEVRGLIESGIAPENLIYYGLEYKYLTLYVIGELPYDRMLKELEIAIHQFAKRQMTWFRGMERRGFSIHWLPYNLSHSSFTEHVLELWTSM